MEWKLAEAKNKFSEVIELFMHFCQPDKPLRTCYGEIACLDVQEMTERNTRLVPYETVD